MGRKLEVCVAESLQTTHITSSVSVLKNSNVFPCRLHCGLTAAFFLSFLRFSQRVLRMRFCTGLSINSVTLHTGHSRVPLASQDRSTQRLQKLCEHVKMTGSLNTSLQTGQLKSSSEKGRLGAILCNFQLRVATFLASGFIQLSSKTFFFLIISRFGIVKCTGALQNGTLPPSSGVGVQSRPVLWVGKTQKLVNQRLKLTKLTKHYLHPTTSEDLWHGAPPESCDVKLNK